MHLHHLLNTQYNLFKFFIFILLLLNTQQLFAQKIVITKIMRNPIGGESAIPGGKSNEYVEITNFGPLPLSLHDLFISNGQTVDSIIAFIGFKSENPASFCNEKFLLPGKSAIILDTEYLSPLNIFRYSIADSAVILTVNHINLLNSIAENDGVFLFRGTRNSISSIVCAALDTGNVASLTGTKVSLQAIATPQEGIPLVPEYCLFSPTAYTASISPHILGTLTTPNKLLRIEYKCLDTLQGAVACSVAIRQLNGDSLKTLSYNLQSTPNTTFLFDSTHTLNDTGTAYLFLKLPLNSPSYKLTVTRGTYSETLTINILAFTTMMPNICITQINPRSSVMSPEWFECFNSGTSTVNLRKWEICTKNNTTQLADADLILDPGSFLIFTNDSLQMRQAYKGFLFKCIELAEWPTLNNYHDTISLKNVKKQNVSEAGYSSQWFLNWDIETLSRPCIACTTSDSISFTLTPRPTPGMPYKNHNSTISSYSLLAKPRLFSPNNDKHDDLLSIELLLPALKYATVKIISMNGTTLREFNNCLSGTIFWDGTTTENSKAPVGPFFIICKIVNDTKAPVLRTKGVLWR